MSLTGHLDVFPLEEVLRLLARSYKSGCLRVDSPDLHGRVYLNNGSLALATVGSDEDLRRQLVGSKLVAEEGLRSAEVGGKSLSEIATDGGTHALAEFFREEVVESLYRIRKPGRGQFVFNVDVAPRYRADTAFDVELCVSEADRRAAEWADIETVISNIDVALRITPEAPNGEPVTLAPNTWRLVAGFEGAGTVRSLADRLGTPRFRVAKDLTALVRSGLVEAAVTAAPEPEAAVSTIEDEPVLTHAASSSFRWEELDQTAHNATADDPAEVLESEQGAPNLPEPAYAVESSESLFVQPIGDNGSSPGSEQPAAEYVAPSYTAPEYTAPVYTPPVYGGYDTPVSEPEPTDTSETSQPEAVKAAEPAASYNQGWWTEPADAEDSDKKAPEGDTPAEGGDKFLDRVFSQLDENPEGQGSTHGTTHGFLKRRRMSSIGADE